jgi:hypothetical protein
MNHKDLEPYARSSVSLRGGFHVVDVGSIGAHIFMKGYHLLDHANTYSSETNEVRH